MSIPRNCDRCGNNFALKAENSGKFNGIIYRQYDNGETYEQHKEWDFCPTCTSLMESPKVGKYDPAVVRALEIENGLTPTEPSPPQRSTNG